MVDWQPVETAPHNEAVLLYLPAAGYSKAEIEVGCMSTGSRNGPYSSISYHGRATHWAPLPSPPPCAGDAGLSDIADAGSPFGPGMNRVTITLTPHGEIARICSDEPIEPDQVDDERPF